MLLKEDCLTSLTVNSFKRTGLNRLSGNLMYVVRKFFIREDVLKLFSTECSR